MAETSGDRMAALSSTMTESAALEKARLVRRIDLARKRWK